MLLERTRRLAIAEFLDFTESREEWFELIDGEIVQMAHTRFNHNVITSNLGFRLGLLLADSDCQVLGRGQGIRSGDSSVLIPDVSVFCGRPRLEADTRILLNPLVVVEVTSPSTVNFDRNEKADYYFDVPSIQAYLVVEQERPLVELYTRGEAGWNVRTFADIADEVPLEALECQLPLCDIYESIDFEMDD